MNISIRGVFNSSRLFPLVLAALFLLQNGCAQFGPDAMRASRLNYNEAVQVSDQRELLLNLVRLRYTDAPEFLEISGISTQMNFEASASIGGDFGEVEDANSAFVTPGASVGYSESPTITFLPRRDKDFTKQLVAPIELDALYLLNNYGWGLDRTFLLIANELNGIGDITTRESTSLIGKDEYTFQEFINTLQQLASEHLIQVDIHHRNTIVSDNIPFESVSIDDHLKITEAGYQLRLKADKTGYKLSQKNIHYVLSVDERAWSRPEFEVICRILNIQPNQSFYDIDLKGNNQPQSIRLATRSVLGVMAYLSAAVSVPDDHKHLVDSASITNSVVENYLKIEVAETIGDEMYLPVNYRGYWFYINDGDLESKRTFGLLTSLIRLTISAGGAQNVPILTLPVSQ